MLTTWGTKGRDIYLVTKIHVKRLYIATPGASVDIVALHFEPNITFSRLDIFKQINTFCM